MENWDNRMWQGKSEERVIAAYKVGFYSLVMLITASIIAIIFT